MLSVVLPAFNESEHLAHTVGALHRGLTERDASFEIVIVENGSSDGTAAVAAALAGEHPEVLVRSLPRPDYGAALRAGILVARGDVVVSFDTDCYDLEFLDAALVLVDPRRGDHDLVVGSKRADGSIDTRPLTRRLVTAAFATVLRVGFHLRISDTHGMKAMRRHAITPLVPRCHFDADLFDTELVIRAQRGGIRITELAVVVAERRPPRTSVWSRLPRTLIGLAQLRILLTRERSRLGGTGTLPAPDA